MALLFGTGKDPSRNAKELTESKMLIANII
jgi:hypothetical protein